MDQIRLTKSNMTITTQNTQSSCRCKLYSICVKYIYIYIYYIYLYIWGHINLCIYGLLGSHQSSSLLYTKLVQFRQKLRVELVPDSTKYIHSCAGWIKLVLCINHSEMYWIYTCWSCHRMRSVLLCLETIAITISSL